MEVYLYVIILLSTVVRRYTGTSIFITVRDHVEFFTSAGYPSTYNRNEDYHWFLTTENASYVVNVDVIDSDIEYSSSCSYDYVRVYDGTSSASKLLKKFCGITEPSFKSSGRYLYVNFHTDTSIERRGFNMTYWSTPTSSTSSLSLPAIVIISTVCGTILIVTIVTIVCHCAHKKYRGRSRVVPASQARHAPWNYSQTTARLPVFYAYNTPRTTRSDTVDSVFYTNPGEALPDYRDLYPMSPPPPYSER